MKSTWSRALCASKSVAMITTPMNRAKRIEKEMPKIYLPRGLLSGRYRVITRSIWRQMSIMQLKLVVQNESIMKFWVISSSARNWLSMLVSNSTVFAKSHSDFANLLHVSQRDTPMKQKNDSERHNAAIRGAGCDCSYLLKIICKNMARKTKPENTSTISRVLSQYWLSNMYRIVIVWQYFCFYSQLRVVPIFSFT